MKEQLVSFETAKLAKEKEFDEDVMCCYNPAGILQPWDSIETIQENYCTLEDYLFCCNSKMESYCTPGGTHISAPTQALLQKWLRNVHYIIVETNQQMLMSVGFAPTVDYLTEVFKYEEDEYGVWRKKVYRECPDNTYENSIEKGLFEALKLIED